MENAQSSRSQTNGRQAKTFVQLLWQAIFSSHLTSHFFRPFGRDFFSGPVASRFERLLRRPAFRPFGKPSCALWQRPTKPMYNLLELGAVLVKVWFASCSNEFNCGSDLVNRFSLKVKLVWFLLKTGLAFTKTVFCGSHALCCGHCRGGIMKKTFAAEAWRGMRFSKMASKGLNEKCLPKGLAKGLAKGLEKAVCSGRKTGLGYQQLFASILPLLM
jgi:hypothetical protein